MNITKRMNPLKRLALTATAAMAATSAHAVMVDLSTIADGGTSFGADGSFSFFSEGAPNFKIDESSCLAGDARGLSGSLGGKFEIGSEPGSAAVAGSGVFSIWDAASREFSGELSFTELEILRDRASLEGKLYRFSYLGDNSDLEKLLEIGIADISLTFEGAGLAELSIGYLRSSKLESTFSAEVMAAGADQVPDRGTTAATLGFGLLVLICAARYRQRGL